MTYRLSELSLLLGCCFNDARAWVRALEASEPVARDARDARLVTAAQLERIAAARVIASTREISRMEAIKFVGQLDRAFETLQWLDASREIMGIAVLETRVIALEKILGEH
jgi:hypothetical protein